MYSPVISGRSEKSEDIQYKLFFLRIHNPLCVVIQNWGWGTLTACYQGRGEFMTSDRQLSQGGGHCSGHCMLTFHSPHTFGRLRSRAWENDSGIKRLRQSIIFRG